MNEKIQLPTQFIISKIDIDGKGVEGLFQSISIFENIYSPTITGSIVLIDSDGANFIEKESIEGVEEIEFAFTNARDEELSFKGYLNGMRNRVIKGAKIIYTFDFHSITMRKNEQEFVTRRFENEPPEFIAQEMTERIGGQVDKFTGQGLPMNFLGSRKRPRSIMEYVLTHGVTSNSDATDNGTSQTENSSGTTGFLWWETLDGYRFASIDGLLGGTAGNDQGEYKVQLQNNSVSMADSMRGIIEHDFKVMGDIQSKMRSGAFRNVFITMDLDKGLYKEIEYDGSKSMTDKQKKVVTKTTRYLWRAFNNERNDDGCNKAPDNAWDQSKLFLSQSTSRHNTSNDQTGKFVLPPQFSVRAGDIFEAKIPKTKSEKEGGYDEKHSGQYVISQVGHHLYSDGRSYTKLTTIRSTTQQGDSSSSEVPEAKPRKKFPFTFDEVEALIESEIDIDITGSIDGALDIF